MCPEESLQMRLMINVQITKVKQSNNGTKNNGTELTTKIVS